MLRQLHYSRLDLELHSRFDPNGSESIFECDRRMAAEVYPMMPLPEDRFLCAFAHIFAGALLRGCQCTRARASVAQYTTVQAALCISLRVGNEPLEGLMVPFFLCLFTHMTMSLAR